MNTSRFWKWAGFVPAMFLGGLVNLWVAELWQAAVLLVIASAWVFCGAMYAGYDIHEDWQRYDNARHRAGIV